MKEKHKVRDNTNDVFFALLRAGLWEQEFQVASLKAVNWNEIYRIAQEQTVIGLIAAGIEMAQSLQGNIIPQEVTLPFIGDTLRIEQRNKLMNAFIAETIDAMRKEGIYTLLVKGQGIAQCYVRPLWRASGDIDFYLCDDNYNKGRRYLFERSCGSKPERKYSKEQGMNIGPWYVEVHGTQRTGLSTRTDKEIDCVQRCVFDRNNVRLWMNSKTQVFIPAPNEDVFIVFTHFIKHFYKERMSLRQLCDWCRLLYTFRNSLNYGLLETRIRKAELMGEWRAFASLAVDYLGMPADAMPLYSADKKWKNKASDIVTFILKGGKLRKWRDTVSVARIFPWNTVKFAPGILLNVNWMKIRERILPVKGQGGIFHDYEAF